ncbi:hypothetical protein [Chryseobacterium aureum]|uniref:hypothetical protein n=1 Tax=Chryseobacterium aureum TaxID=2497456 RepID=UPI000F877AC5|nr:hypothetical protein [Chryseobacterium aureum]
MKKNFFYLIFIWSFYLNTLQISAQAIVQLPGLGCGRLLNVNTFRANKGSGICVARIGREAENPQNMVDLNINSYGRINLGTGAAIGCRMYLAAYRDDGIKFPSQKPIYLDIEAQGFNFNASFNGANVVFYKGNMLVSRQSIGGKLFFDFGNTVARKLVKFIPPLQWDRIEIETNELAGIGFTFLEIKVYNILSEFYYPQNITFNTNPTGKTVIEGDDASMQANIDIKDEIPKNISFNWQVNTGTGWNDLTDNGFYSGTNTLNLQINNIPASFDNYKYRLTAKTQFGNCSFNGNSNQAILKVNYVMAGQIGSDQTLCKGKDDNPLPFTQLMAAVGSGILNYQWESSLNNISFVSILGATNPTFDPPAGITQSTYYRRKVTSILNGTLESNYSNVLKVTVQKCLLDCIISNRMVTNLLIK